MIHYQLAENEDFDELLKIIYYEGSYLKPVLDLIQITWDQFGQYFRSTGKAYRILVDDRLAGLCWVEVHGRTLDLNGLIVKNSFQGKGIGTCTLSWLEERFCDEVDEIQLSVHESNHGARALYERSGYRAADAPDTGGFYRMKKKPRKPARSRNKKEREFRLLPSSRSAYNHH